MKKIIAILLAVITMFALFGCTKEEPKFYEAHAVADALNANLEFGEELEKSSADIAYTVYGIEPSLCSDAALYIGSGATADEIAVFNCVDDEACNKVYQAAESRLNYILEGYKSYGPSEVPKIEATSVIKEGNTVILCICYNPEKIIPIADSVAQ